MVDQRTLILAVKPAVATAGALLLAWDALERRRDSPRHQRLRDIALAFLGALAFACWWNLGAFHFGNRYVHAPEFLHYYLGTKYFHELGYTRLYECVAEVEIEHGRAQEISRRWIRDLTNNQLKRGASVLRDPSVCRQHFTDDRWTSFSNDVLWFRDQVPSQKWTDLTLDHGYNGSPVWRMTAAAAARGRPASAEWIRTLALIDPALLLIMWAIVWWAFGWRVMCVALVWWGTNVPAGFTYIGGAFLRQDWLLLSVAAVALARRGWPTMAGFALGWATLLRLFPILLAVGLALQVALDVWRRRSWRPDALYLRFAAGMALAGVILVPLSFAAEGGVEQGRQAWAGFVSNTEKHAASRAANHLGLQAVLSFDPHTRAAVMGEYWLDAPWDTWAIARDNTLQSRRPIFWLLSVVFLVALARALDSRPPWIALALSATLVPILMDISNYYYGLLLVLAFLWPAVPVAGFGLSLVAAFSGAAMVLASVDDDRAVLTSVAILMLVWTVVLILALSRRRVPPLEQSC